MQIRRIETFMAPPRWMFVRVETDEGLVGWGEPVVEGRAEPVRAAVRRGTGIERPHAGRAGPGRCLQHPHRARERLFSRREFLAPLEAGVAVAQPDVSHAGGISELRRIASLAEVYGAQLAPHCPLGPIALAASIQDAFTTANFLIQEQSIGIHYNRGAELLDYVVDPEPFHFHGGSFLRTARPGLGIEVDETAVRSADKKGHAWRNPVWRYEDGSFAEW